MAALKRSLTEAPAAKGAKANRRAKAAPDRRQRALLLPVSGIDPAARLLDRSKTEPELLLQRSGEDAAHSMALPPGRPRHFFCAATTEKGGQDRFAGASTARLARVGSVNVKHEKKPAYLLTALVNFATYIAMSTQPIPRPIADVWSEPTSGLSGRLRLEFEDLQPGLRHAVYLELKNHSLSPVAVTNQPEIQTELFDSAGKPVRTAGVSTSPHFAHFLTEAAEKT
jgi:hypothetical protein